MVIYTVCGSLPLLVLLGYASTEVGRDRIIVLCNRGFGWSYQGGVFWFLLMVGMLVKVPVFLVHG